MCQKNHVTFDEGSKSLLTLIQLWKNETTPSKSIFNSNMGVNSKEWYVAPAY